MLKLKPSQRRFLKGALDPDIDVACLSIPRGNGKSFLGAFLLSRVMDPGDDLFRAGTESVLMSGSIEQCRIIFRFVRATLEPRGGYRFLDSATRVAITHVSTNTRLRVIGSNAKTSFGLVGCPYAVLDECGSFEKLGGSLLWDAVLTSLGKPGSPMKAILLSTLAPATSGWWHELVEKGSTASTYVQSIVGNESKWDQWPEIARCNPLWTTDPRFRRRLLEERDEARSDSRLKARFLSYRLNLPSGDPSSVLLTVDDFKTVTARAVPERRGSPIIGLDLGGGRAWSAAVSIWQSGRVEALAVCPGLPSIEAQERRDRVEKGTYQRLLDQGTLRIAPGLRVQPPGAVWEAIVGAWGSPGAVWCDRFRLPELLDVIPQRVPVLPRMQRWSESSFDIRALRKLAKDGPLAIEESSRSLLQASLSVATVKEDDAGSTRIIKRGSNNQSRDDVAVALCLAAGAFARAGAAPVRKAYHGIA